MSRPINQTNTLTTHPTSIDNTHSVYPGTFYNNNDLDNCFTDASSSTRAAFYTTTGSRAVTQIYLNFDECADIPSGATINSVSCSVKCGTQGTNYFSTRTVQMCTGTTTKGSATTMSGSNSSPSTHNLSVGTWTASELQNAKLYFHIIRGTSNTTTDATFSVFGATLTVNYTVNGIAYTIAATSNVSGITVDPASQEQLGGEDAVIAIYGDSLDDVNVTDNDINVKDQLVRHTVPSGGTLSTDLGSYSLVSGGFNSSGTSYFSGLVGAGIDHTRTTSNYYSSGSGTIAVFTYNLDFENIPSNATITALTCEVNGHAESTSQNNEYMCVQLISGSTALSDELNFKSVGTCNSTQTLTATTLPTVAQLANLKLQCRLGYYGGAINGATCTITYTVPGGGSYYWEYTLNNINDDHVILIEEAGAFIPPEEDPQKVYYPITISSINASTNPRNGTTRVEAGTTQVITITPTDPQLTLALDNGVDITSQLQGGIPNNTYTVETQADGASYGFTLNSSTGYYKSTNNGVGSSASVARVSFDLESNVLVTIQYINQGESQADYGMFGKIDTTVSTTGNTYIDSSASPDDPQNYYYMCAAASDSSTSTKTLTYEIPMGQHYIDIKYAKDQASDSGLDSLQWKILSIEATSAGGDYTYTLTNINQKHSLIFVFGDVDFYYITASGNACKLYPDGQVVKLDGDSYNLTIVPNDPHATVSITDNNIDRTSLLQYEEGQDKNGNTIVNYTYNLSNISATHTLVINCVSGSGAQIYLKRNGVWTPYSKVYLKINGTWVEQNSSTWSTVLDARKNYKINT